MMERQAKIRCYYEVLEVSKKATYEEIRKAYKLKSLQYHPDKNYGNHEEAAEKFKEVNNAYSILSNADERAWYDAHREQILYGEENRDDPNEVDLFSFFRSSCYSGFSDVDSNSFYSVYGKLFDTLRNIEIDSDERGKHLPCFGKSTTPWTEVQKFYAAWKNFSSFRSFAWKDEYKVNEMEDRYARRAAERINMKARSSAKKEYLQNIRDLAQFVYRRDPRVEAEMKRQKEAEEDARRIKEEKERDHLQRRQEAKEKLWAEAAEREEREEAERAARGEPLDGTTIDLLYEQERQTKAMMSGKAHGGMTGFAMLEPSDDLSSNSSYQAYKCKACKKQFKSENQLKEHNNSGKHKAKLKQLAAKGINTSEILGETAVGKKAEETVNKSADKA